MSWNLNHYRSRDLERDLRQLDLKEDAEVLLKLQKDIYLAYEVRNAVANQLLKKHLDKISPLLRPCHKKRMLELKITD